MMMHWLAHWLGMDNPSGPLYLFYSGFGANFGELAIAAGLLAGVRKHNCEVRRCWRLGRHATAAGHTVCRKHHPDDHLTAEAVAAGHQSARDNETREGA